MPPRRSGDRARADRRRRAAYPVDVADRGDEFLVTVELPGFRKQDLDVTVKKNRLRIVAEDDETTDGIYLRRERPRGGADFVVRLPQAVDERHVSASYTGGVLRVTLRKRGGPRQVDVR